MKKLQSCFCISDFKFKTPPTEFQAQLFSKFRMGAVLVGSLEEN
jgi:hypothetical protein